MVLKLAAMSIALYLGLNPALQRRVDLEKLAVGSVNRARDSSSGIGGKGQGAYVAALQLEKAEKESGVEGLPVPQLSMFLGAGNEGDALGELLSRRAERSGAADSGSLWTRVASKCRICTTLIDVTSGDATEIVEPSGQVTQSEWEELLESLGSASSGGVSALGIMGTMPPGLPKDGYAQIVERACGPCTKVLMDSVVEVPGTLAAAVKQVHGNGASSGGIALKLNAREVLKLVGQELVGSDSQVAADPLVVVKACQDLAARVGSDGGSSVDYVCYTDGPFPGGVVAIRSGRKWSLERKKQLRGSVVSPIGAGDSTAAGTLHAWCRKAESDDPDLHMVDAFRFGLSVGAASCLTGENALFDIADVRDIYETIEVTELS